MFTVRAIWASLVAFLLAGCAPMPAELSLIEKTNDSINASWVYGPKADCLDAALAKCDALEHQGIDTERLRIYAYHQKPRISELAD